MNKNTHRIYIASFFLISVAATILLAADGFNYYMTSIEERFFNHKHALLKPSGYLGHGYGILGTFMMIFGVGTYMIRKRSKGLFNLGYLKHWLEFHIFLCTLGPILVLYHTAFKFGGIVAVSFWSMVAVVLSGVVGRFIYIQIPRTIHGQEISIKELNHLNDEYSMVLRKSSALKDTLADIESISSADKYRQITARESFIFLFKDFFRIKSIIKSLKRNLQKSGISKPEMNEILDAVKNRLVTTRRIGMLRTMQGMFRYWHIIHLPFAIVMFVIMIIHVVITIVFGYKWIF